MKTHMTWRKSSHSATNGECIEAAGNWRKSSHSAYNGGCAEVGTDGTVAVVLVRDTKNRGGAMLRFTPQAWREFTGRMKA